MCGSDHGARSGRALAAEWLSGDFTVEGAPDLAEAAGKADIISCATMAREPVLGGAWIRPGTHVDLIGPCKADMREADDDLMSRASLFADSRQTTLHHIGELMIPLSSGVIAENNVLGDLYDLIPELIEGRKSAEKITVFGNGGGARLDLMMVNFISKRLQSEQ